MDSILIVGILAIAIIAALAWLGWLTTRTSGGNKEASELKTELAAKDEALQTAESAAKDLEIQNARVEQELQARNAALEKADASLTALEAQRDKLKVEVSRLQTIESGLTERLSSMTKSLDEVRDAHVASEANAEQLRKRAEQLSISEGELKAQLESAKEQLSEREDFVKQAKESFKVLSTQTLEQQQSAFMKTADANLKEREAAVKKLVDPLREQIERFGQQRDRSEGQLGQQIRELASETTGLASALRRPEIRGQWGEVQLERVLELSGLQKDIDYTTQDSFNTESGRHRTDVIVRMPHNRSVVLDSKVSLSALMNASSTDDPGEKTAHMAEHVEQVKRHIQSLADKRYWEHLDSAPDVVVMVLPEFAFLAALEREPDLAEQALGKRVLLVTPPAVLALLRAVELNWQQIRVAETAQQISELGRQLHADIVRYSDSVAKVGRGLRSAVNGYNSSVATFQSNVVRRSERFQDLGIALTGEISDVPEVTENVREFEALYGPDDDDNSNGAADVANADVFATDDHEHRGALV